MKIEEFLNTVQTPKDIVRIMNDPKLQTRIGKNAKFARRILSHPNIKSIFAADVAGKQKLTKAFTKKFPVTTDIVAELFNFGKKKVKTVGCMNLESRLGEGGLGIVELGSLNEGVLRTYNHIKLAEMWSQMSEAAGLYLPLKTQNGDGDSEELTKRERNRGLIEEIQDNYSRQELFEFIVREMRGKKYAVKFNNMSNVDSYSAQDVGSARRYRREFELTNILKYLDENHGHENIVRLLFEEEPSCITNPEDRDKSRSGMLYYVMELLEGGDLAEKTAEVGIWDLDEALEVIMKVADALTYAHSKGIIHRDMKPENVMFTKDGEVRVTDFGLGKDTSDKDATNLSKSGYAMGTPMYMPLEQAKSAKHVKKSADIYSLGLTLYRMISETMPFDLEEAENLTQIVDRLQRFEGRESEFVPYPKAKPGSQKDALNKVMTKAIQINPRLRYSSMERFTEDLAKVWTWENASESEREIDMRMIDKDIAKRKKQAWWGKWKLPVVAGVMGGLAALGITGALIFGGDDYRDQIKATQATYTKRFADAKNSQNEQKYEELLSKLEKYNDKKKSPEIAKYLTKKRKVYNSIVESRLEREISADFARAEGLESRGLLVEAHSEYSKLISTWGKRKKDVKKKKVKRVYSRNASKPEDIKKKIWKLDGKDQAWRTLEFCVQDVRKRGDHTKVNADEYHSIAVLLAKKVVEPLAQADTDKIPVAVKKDGTWWKERQSKLEWETRRAPGDFVASIWECYQMFKGTSEEQKWLGYARKWMNIFQEIDEDNVDAFVGKTLLDNHFVAMQVDPSRSEVYKREIRRLCDLIVQKKWNEELEFLMHYMVDGESSTNKLYSEIAGEVLALHKAHILFNEPRYKEKADKTLEMLLKHQRAGKRSAQIFNMVRFEAGKSSTASYKLGSIEMYIQYAELFADIYELNKNKKCKDFAIKIYKWLFDNVDLNEVPHYSIFSYIIRKDLKDEQAQSYRRFGMQKAHRLLPEFIVLADKFRDYGQDHTDGTSRARYTFVSTIDTTKNWQGISGSDTDHITETTRQDMVTGIKPRGITSNINATSTTNMSQISAYFKALRKK